MKRFDRSKAWDDVYSSGVLRWRGAQRDVPELPEGARVLELGCGNGKTLAALDARKLDVYAIDFSEAAVGLCSKFKGVRISRENVLKTSFRNSFFDAVLCFHVLAHMPLAERRRAAGEISRVMKKGGRLFFRDFSAGDFRFGKGQEVEPDSFRRQNGITTHYFSEKEARALFRPLECAASEEVLRRGTHHGTPYVHAEWHLEFRKP